LHIELDKIREDLKLFNLVRDNAFQDDSGVNPSKLMQRVQELEDLVQEFKNQSSP